MSAAKYTPGELARLTEEAGARVAAEKAEKSAASNAQWKLEEERRLRLAAAAPDLLAALEKMQAIVQAWNREDSERMYATGPALIETAAAIAKARGE